ncbi:MAG: PaaI family thioesterase [Bacteroidota bacterium]
MMESEQKLQHNVQQLLDHDPFSRWLGLEVTVHGPGTVTAAMNVRKEMLNGFNVCHGGITFSLADSVLAFASNTYGKVAVSIEASIAYPNPVFEGDRLIAVSKEVSRTERIGIFTVTITKENGIPVGDFRGIVYITKKEMME